MNELHFYCRPHRKGTVGHLYCYKHPYRVIPCAELKNSAIHKPMFTTSLESLDKYDAHYRLRERVPIPLCSLRLAAGQNDIFVAKNNNSIQL